MIGLCPPCPEFRSDNSRPFTLPKTLDLHTNQPHRSSPARQTSRILILHQQKPSAPIADNDSGNRPAALDPRPVPFSQERLVTDPNLLDMIAQTATLPTMPEVVTSFLELSAQPECEVKDLVAVLQTDPGIASELLRLSNSPLFGVTREVASLKQAVTLLGLARVRTLVLGRYLAEQIDGQFEPEHPIKYGYYWRRSLGTAVLAAQFADLLFPAGVEQAFISGLLADGGVAVLQRTFPDTYKPVAERYLSNSETDFVAAEIEEVGVSHADVSAMVLERWMLPPIVVEAVRLHHIPQLHAAGDALEVRLARVLAGSARIAKLLTEPAQLRETIFTTCIEAIELVGLELHVLGDVLQRIDGDIQEFARLLRIEVIGGDACRRVADAVTRGLNAQAETTNPEAE